LIFLVGLDRIIKRLLKISIKGTFMLKISATRSLLALGLVCSVSTSFAASNNSGSIQIQPQAEDMAQEELMAEPPARILPKKEGVRVAGFGAGDMKDIDDQNSGSSGGSSGGSSSGGSSGKGSSIRKGTATYGRPSGGNDGSPVSGGGMPKQPTVGGKSGTSLVPGKQTVPTRGGSIPGSAGGGQNCRPGQPGCSPGGRGPGDPASRH